MANFKILGKESSYVKKGERKCNSNQYRSNRNWQAIFSITIFEKCGQFFQ